MSTRTETRAGEYAERGDYHRRLDPHWSYAPIYRRKLQWVDRILAETAEGARIVDVGAGEGALVERYRSQGRDIVGIDAFYESTSVERGDLLNLPCEDASFDVALCLDVLEHVDLLEQPRALSEIARILKGGGLLLLSVPNLAHLHSRLRFLFTGKLTRTSAIERHPGDRPLAEYVELVKKAGFRIERRSGIFPTVPLAYRAVNRNPAAFDFVVSLLDAIVPFVGLRFLAMLQARKLAG